MKRLAANPRLVLLLLLALGCVVIAGCASTGSEDFSERPWNTPQGWENGLPSNINEGR